MLTCLGIALSKEGRKWRVRETHHHKSHKVLREPPPPPLYLAPGSIKSFEFLYGNPTTTTTATATTQGDCYTLFRTSSSAVRIPQEIG